MKAIWRGEILAESSETIVIEGNHYFPPNSINTVFFEKSEYQTRCPWKGLSLYYTLNVNGEINKNAAWYYPEPSDAAKNIKGYVAFWEGVEII